MGYEDRLDSWKRAFAETKKRDADFTTISGDELKPLYTKEDLPPDIDERLGVPGEYPFTRGPYTTMYRSRLWTMRQFAGFGSAADTNERYKYLLANGQNGLSVAFDMPTLMGYDADDPHSEGEVGRCGVAVSSMKDMEILFDGIDMEKISTSMTINSPAPMIWAMYIVAAEKQGADRKNLRGTLQNDILKEYTAQKEYLFPPEPSLSLVTDTSEFATNEMPFWHAVSISGYHIREAGSTAVQELAFTLANGFAYIEDAIKRGVDVDRFAPRMSHFFNAHSDFFEEICKYRAARRIYARRMKERYGAKRSDSMRLRFHTQTAGCSLTAQEPENNIVRVAIQALSGVLGGTQSLHTNSMDETLALPTEKAVTIALRTQQILAYETGVANVTDPLAGSYFVENLTARMEREAEDYLKRIDDMGGVIRGIENGFFQREIGEASYQYQKASDEKRQFMVGVNIFNEDEEGTIPDIEIETLRITQEMEDQQKAAVREVKASRDSAAVARELERLENAARAGENLMPYFIGAVREYATLGEMINVIKTVHGEYLEPAVF
jgi:methylmalonyl-CoA mutase N-terminal domain/subunit